MSKSKAKGTAAESAVVKYLNDSGILAQRNPLHGTKDTGDIWIPSLPVVIEVKNCKTMKLSEWVDEAEEEKDNASVSIGVVWHHRARKGNPADWYVTMSGTSFVKLLKSIGLSFNL